MLAQRLLTPLRRMVGRRGVGGARHGAPTHIFTGWCPIREHTADGRYVGRCDFATYDGACPRHGLLGDYPNSYDRTVRVADRRWP